MTGSDEKGNRPELSASGIAELCQVCNAMTIIYDSRHEELAEAAAALMVRHYQFNIQSILEYPNSPSRYNEMAIWRSLPTDVAYVHHTSGTSTGKPKPIRISHHGAVGVLPVFDDPSVSRKATFTTTPLYHGGPADVFRAWTSSSMIWLFPGVQNVPITADNVLRALDVAKRFSQHHPPNSHEECTRVRYLTCVPFIIEMIAEKPDGLDILRKMELVGVGGAALSKSVGDRLVEEGVNLISRYGSAECGFILSSRRNYNVDKGWDYLRIHEPTGLRFDIQETGLAELVIDDWPFMAKSNRIGGLFATADLFEAHPTIPHAWKYNSRADSQLTLSTGKKFDPAPIEAKVLALARPSQLLSDIYIFGSGRPFPGALLFKSEVDHGYTDSEVRQKTLQIIDRVNVDSPPYARIAPYMLAVVAASPGLKKSSKGTILRTQADNDYATLIDQAYSGRQTEQPEFLDVEDIQRSVEYIITSVLAEKLQDGRTPWVVEEEKEQNEKSQETLNIEKYLESGGLWTAPLFDIGVNSMEALQIRTHLNDNFGHLAETEIPLGIVYECGTAEKIAEYVVDLQEGKQMRENDQAARMRDLVDYYANNFQITSRGQYADSLQCREKIVLTGVTGTLGVWIFNTLRFSDYVEEIHCLIRAANHQSAKQRVVKVLEKRFLSPLESSKAKVYFYPCKLSEEPTLGLDPEDYERLVRETSLIIHAAWEVNFSMSLASFEKDHIGGLHNLIEFANSSPKEVPPCFVFCSSTASVLGPHGPSFVKEEISDDPNTSSPMGYSRSKWIAESICERAHQYTRLHDHISVLRIGQLCGDGLNGIWNVTEAWPLMFSSLKVVHCLPNLTNEKLDWLPVDIAARAIIQVASSMLHRPLDPRGDDPDKEVVNSALDLKRQVDNEEGEEGKKDDDACPVYHVINRNSTPVWADLLRWIQALDDSLEVVAPAEWVSRLENLQGDAANHPSRKLLGMWKAAYCGNDDNASTGGKEVSFEMEKTMRVAPVLGEVQPISKEHFEKVRTTLAFYVCVLRVKRACFYLALWSR